VEEWQAKRGTPAGAQRLTTAFLDGTHPIVDVYELKVTPAHSYPVLVLWGSKKESVGLMIEQAAMYSPCC